MLYSGSICNSKQLKIIWRDDQIQFKYNMLKLCELPWSSSAYDSVAICMYVYLFTHLSIIYLSTYPLIAFNFPQWISHFTFLLSTEHHRVWIHSSLESRVQGRGNKKTYFNDKITLKREHLSYLPCERPFAQWKICSWNMPSYTLLASSSFIQNSFTYHFYTTMRQGGGCLKIFLLSLYFLSCIVHTML